MSNPSHDEQWAKLADYYRSQGITAALTGDHQEAGQVPEPMVTTAVQLPQRILAEVQAEASRCGMAPSTLISEILERELAGDLSRKLDLEQRVSALEDVVRHLAN